MEKDKEVTLHFIEQLHTALHESGKSVNIYAMAALVLSLVLLGMTSGLASADDKISALGLTITCPVCRGRIALPTPTSRRQGHSHSEDDIPFMSPE